jgi:hypothetical protein
VQTAPCLSGMRTMILTLLLTTASAFADPTPDASKMKADDCAQARKQNKTCVLSIEDESIEGNKPVAGETSVLAIKFSQHSSLIRIRRDFISEILKSAEDL